MKGLYWDRTGFCVWAERLERGRFVSNWAQVSTRQMDWTELDAQHVGVARSPIAACQLHAVDPYDYL